MSEPLVALDAAGKAAVISYDVPEPSSYSGRNYVEIPLPQDAFTTPVATAAKPAAFAPKPAAAAPAAIEIPQESATPAVLAPKTVVLGRGEPDGSPIVHAEQPLSERLAKLTVADVDAAVASEKQVVIYPDVAGQLDYRLVSTLLVDGGGDGQDPHITIPVVWAFIDTPAGAVNGEVPLTGPKAGVTCQVAGRYKSVNASALALTLTVDNGAAAAVTLNPNGTWSTSVKLTTSGLHTIKALISGTGYHSGLHKQITVNDTAVVAVKVMLDAADPKPAPALPSVTVTTPASNSTLTAPAGSATLQVAGGATAGVGATIASVAIRDEFDGKVTQAAKVGGTLSQWSVQMLLAGLGQHRLTIRATDNGGNQSPTKTVDVLLSAQQPSRRLLNRLLLVETLNLSSYLGSFGAGRVIKTFSLLPGEKTTLSIKSWTKSAESRKTGSSIVDSEATEASSSFEDALSAEQTSKESLTETTNYKIGASVGASWGWGSASINAEYSGSANAAREEAVKNVRSATRKQAMKASANRSVTINTEYTSTKEEGEEESTTREIANVNVSRTLNFVFRQMNQQHITLIHLTNARVAYYAEDLMLDAQGNPAYRIDEATQQKVLDIRPSYTEVSLPQLSSLLGRSVTPDWQPKVQQAIEFALSGIPDYNDQLQDVFEWVLPKKGDKEVVGAAYMRFRRKLETKFVDPESKQEFTIPGIVLAYDHVVMRTDGVMVDAVLGQGDGLDTYSHGLQNVAVAERQLVLAERQAELDRLALARDIVKAKDKDAAEVFAMVFPPTAMESEATVDGRRALPLGLRAPGS